MPNVSSATLATPGPTAKYDLDITEETFPLVADLLAHFGDVCRVSAVTRKQPSFLLNNADHVRHVLVNNHRNYIKGVGFDRVKLLLGNGIIVSDGAFWRSQRRMVQPAFHRDVIASLCRMMQECNDRLLARWRQAAERHEQINLTDDVSRLSLEIVLRALFGDDYAKLAGAQERPFDVLTEDPARDLQTVVKFRALTRQVLELVYSRNADSHERFDILAMLMDARHQDSGEPMTERALIDEIMTLIVAGHETTAGTLNWAWYLLAQHPQVEHTLHEEVDRLDGEHAPQFEDLPKLGYARQIVQETLRLYPPVWLFARRAVDCDRVGDHEIPAGADVFISPYFMHRNTAHWQDPDVFDPSRFTEAAMKQRHRCAFIPFSAGPRRCIGDVFAIVDMQIHFGMVARELALRFVPDNPVEIEPRVNLRSRYPLTFEPRFRTSKK